MVLELSRFKYHPALLRESQDLGNINSSSYRFFVEFHVGEIYPRFYKAAGMTG